MYSELFAHLPDPILHVSESERLFYVNTAAEMDHVFATSALNERQFRELHRRMQSADEEDRDRLGEAEKKRYAEVLTEINEIQREAQARMVETIGSKDLSIERFNPLILAVREDRGLRQAVQRRV